MTTIGFDKGYWIDQYVSAGYSLFRLNGKHPVKGNDKWQHTPFDPLLDAEDLPRNYGVVLKEDDLVVDVDPRNFIRCIEGKLVDGKGKPFKGDPALFNLEEGETDNPLHRLLTDFDMDSKPQTFVTKTGGGGLHIYLKKPPGFRTRVNHQLYPGIDFKRRGHFLVGPGSIHPDTKKQYTVIRFTPKEIIDAPQGLLDLLFQEDAAVHEGLDSASDDEGARHRYITYLKNAPGAVENCGGDLTTYRTAALGRDFGLSFETVCELMATYYNIKCEPQWSREDLRKKVKNAFSYAQSKQGSSHPEVDFATIADEIDVEEGDSTLAAKEKKYIKWEMDSKGKPAKNDLGNTANYFLNADFESYVNPLYRLLRFNEFADQIEFNCPAPWHSGRPHKFWTDTDAVQLRYWLSQEKNYVTQTHTCYEAAISLATTLYRYHPVRQYLESLEWDGTPRLDSLLSTYAGASANPYTQAVGKNTLIAAVARAFEPGCKFDHILILEGAQGTGKSTFVKTLGGAWYKSFTVDPHNKDTIDAMRGGWVIEMAELETVRRSDVQALKAFITRESDFVRPAYARVTRDFPRSSVFIGTINPELGGGYLRDSTGNRRFWPVETNDIDIPALKRDRDQLWAEACHRYKAGEPYHLVDAELIKAAEAEQAARAVDDPWEELVAEWMEREKKMATLPEIITTSFVAIQALNLSAKQIDRNGLVRIATILRNLGWEKGKFYVKELGKSASAFRYDYDWLDDL